MKTQTQHPLSGLKSGTPDDQLPSRAITAAVTPFPPRPAPSTKRSRSWLLLLAVILGVAMPLKASAYTVANLNDAGAGSLRDGIAGSDSTINFSVTGIIVLTSGELVVNRPLTIAGPGASQLTISGNFSSRVFNINITPETSGVTISDLTVANGLAAGGDGGGITCSSNGFPYGARFTRLIVTGNTAGHDGGGLYITRSGCLFLNCTISGNTAGNDGGGLFNKAPFGIRTGGYLLESTVSGNGAGHDGGGIYTYYQAGYFSSTISGNSAARNGGGLYGSPDMIHLTITQNVADQDSDGTGDGGGVYCPYPDFPCYDNIIAENFDTPNNAGPGQKHRDISGILHYGDYNLIQDITGWTMPGTHNITGLPPVLGPLANNGGPTFTHALLLGSPALDAGDTTYNIVHDQRGQPIADGDCDEIAQPDIGAYEAPFDAFGINHAAPTIVSATADCHSGKITIAFSGPVNLATAQTAVNFSVAGGTVVIVNAAVFGSNHRTVILDTMGLDAGIPYTLTIGSIIHLCGTVSALNSQITFACPSEIRGRVFIDADSLDGCTFTSGTDLPLVNWTVQLNPGAVNATTDANGEYYFTVTPGPYTINEVVQANWVQTCPVGSYSVLVGTTQVVALQNFANQATTSVTDVAVDMVAVYPFGLTAPCCDVEMTYVISYVNKGTVAVNNATVQLDLLPGTTYQSSSANPLLLPPSGTNPYTWTLPTPLQPSAQGLIYVTVLVDSCGANTPLLTAKAELVPYISGDANQSDNSTTHNVMVSCSFDPNDLQVSPKGCGLDGLVPRDTTFTYLILFQNLGSGPAHRVVVHDTLAAGLDLSTVNVLSSSHAYNLTANGQELVWTFSGIELPYADADEPGSHGFIRFQVRTLAGAVAGTQIPNVAQVYFDLNPAVVTSTTLNTLTNDPLPVASFSISATGNPFTRSFHYTGGTPGATLLWDFGAGASPSIAMGPSPQGVVFPAGFQRAVLYVSLTGCEVEPAVRIFKTGTTNGLEIRIEPLGGQVKLTWDGGVLQESSTLPASWADAAMQESPWMFTPIAPKKFFRVRVP